MATNNTSNTIWTIGGNKKFLDARDGLVAAYPKDYAMLHGKGGKNHASRSGIVFSITDYANGNSKFVKASVPIHIIYKMKTICEKNFGIEYNGLQNICAAMTYEISKVDSISNAFNQMCMQGINGCQRISNRASNNQYAEIANALASAKQVLDNGAATATVNVAQPYTDVVYRQERVNTYKQTADNFVSVSICSISRTQYRQDGSISKLPWNVNIQNFMAPAKTHSNGTTSYINQPRDKVDASINVSDDDMYELLIHTDHYIRLWETIFCTNNIIQGWTNYHTPNNDNNVR